MANASAVYLVAVVPCALLFGTDGAVVFLTAIPIAVLFIADGMGTHHAAEVLAGVIVSALVGIPPLVMDVMAHLRRG